MMALLVFTLRAVVFGCAIFSKMYFKQTYVVGYSIGTHILLSSLQMCLVFVAIGAYKASVFVVSTVHEGVQYEYVQEDVDAEAAVAAGEEPAADICASPCGSKVVFENADAVRRHVMRIHATAVLLWGTLYSFDVSSFDIFYYFVVGLLLGWVAVLWFQARGPHAKMSVVYVLLCAAVLLLNHPAAWASAREALVAGLFPLACGAAWMVWVDTLTVVDDSQSVLVTCLLICALIISTNAWEEMRGLLASSRVVFVYLLCVEPAIKGLALCVLVLSVHTKYKKETMLMFATIYGLACLYLRAEPRDAVFASTLALTTVLLLSQVAGVCRREFDACRPCPAVL